MGLTDIVKQLDVQKSGLYSLSSGDLRRLKQVYLEMLDDIQRVCRKYKIEWILTAGSLLGAVRHKGFIPWDDDIDLNFTRANYNRFSDVFEKELGTKYILKRPGDDRYLLHFPTIQKKNTCVQQILSPDDIDNGVTMDIFIMENTYDNVFLRFLHGIGSTAYLFIDSAVKTKAAEANVKRYSEHSPALMKAYKKRAFFASFFSFRSLPEWMRRSDRYFSKVKNDNSKYIVVPSGRGHYFGELYLRDKMTKVKSAKFENIDVLIPVDYDYYLSLRYGADYMTPPSNGHREQHAVIRFDLESS